MFVATPRGYSRGLLGVRQALSSQSYNVQRGIMVPVENQAATGAAMHSVGQLLTGAMTAVGACLRGVGGVHRDQATTSIFRFVRQVRDELPPRCIMDGLRKAVVVDHGVDREVFDGNDVMPVDDLAAFLMREVRASIGDALMDARHHLTALAACGRGALTLPRPWFLTQAALGTGQVVLVAPEEAGVGELLTRRKGRELFKPHVNPDRRIRHGQRRGLAGERDKPLTRAGTAHATRLDGPSKRTMDDRLEAPDLGEEHPVTVQLVPRLRIAKRVVPFAPTEARIARRLTCLHATKERLKGEVNPNGHVLQDLAMHAGQRRALGFERPKGGPLLRRALDLCPSPRRRSCVAQASDCTASGIHQAPPTSPAPARAWDTTET